MTDPKATIVDSQTLVGQVISDRYEVIDHLGDGSMGVVFLAEHTHMKKKLAIKVMRQEFLDNPEAVERFQREAQAAGHIEHPHVCAASDFGRLQDDRFFLVMEYLEGKTLGDLLDDERRLQPSRVVKIIGQIASGLQRAHELGVVHRDLKPDNIILIDREGDSDFVKITDFGVARVEVVDKQQLTQAGTTMGTPVYMSPEQAVAKRADERSDLYTLGVMMFEMLTGEVPFYSDSLAVILSKHSTEPPPSMHDVAPDALIPQALVRIVEKLLEKDPAHRYATAGDLMEALNAADLSPSIPGLEADEPAPRVAAAATATSAPAVSGDDAFSSDVDVEVSTPAALQYPPAREEKKTFADLSSKFFELPAALRYGAVFVVLIALATPVVGGAVLLLGANDGGGGEEEPGPMAFTEDEVRPVDLEEEQEDFLDDHDLAEKVATAGPEDTVSALEPLLEENSNNAHLRYLLGRSYMDAGKPEAAMTHYQKALEHDPRYAGDSRVLSDTARQFGSKKDEDASAAVPVMVALLDSPAASAARTSAYDVAIDGSWGASKRARELLQTTGSYEQLEPWQRTAIDLRLTGKNCERVKKLVNELGNSGEPRALPALEKASRRPTEGCGFLNKGDCYKCARGDMKKAITSLQNAQGTEPDDEGSAE